MTRKLTKIDVLRERHQAIDDIVDEMAIRPFLTPEDKDRFKSLKIQRLHIKRTIQNIEDKNILMPTNFEVK
jgi:hypothetical protein